MKSAQERHYDGSQTSYTTGSVKAPHEWRSFDYVSRPTNAPELNTYSSFSNDCVPVWANDEIGVTRRLDQFFTSDFARMCLLGMYLLGMDAPTNKKKKWYTTWIIIVIVLIELRKIILRRYYS